MNTRNVLLPALTTLLSTVLLTAQATAQDGKAVTGHVKDAVASQTSLGVPLMFPVEGLTADNVDVVKRSLMAMTETVHVCPKCDHMSPKTGKCTSCDVDMEAKKMPIFSEAKPSLQNENITLIPFSARSLRFSVLRSTLLKDAVEFDDAEFPITGQARIVLLGSDLDSVGSIEKALVDSKLFASVKANFAVDSSETHVVVRPKATPATYRALATVIEGLGGKVTFTDLVWGPLPIPAKI